MDGDYNVFFLFLFLRVNKQVKAAMDEVREDYLNNKATVKGGFVRER
jgi:hypothetical protein